MLSWLLRAWPHVNCTTQGNAVPDLAVGAALLFYAVTSVRSWFIVIMTPHVHAVLAVLVIDPVQERYPLEIGEMTGLLPSTIYRVMARLAKAGWVRDRWEEIDPCEEGRPPRRYWQLVPEHLDAVRAVLQARRVVIVRRDN